MVETKTKFSWFQKVVLAYFTILFLLQGYMMGGGIASAIGYAFGGIVVIFLPMWLFNKFVVPKIKVNNKILIKSWLIIRIILTLLMLLWVFLFVAGPFWIGG